MYNERVADKQFVYYFKRYTFILKAVSYKRDSFIALPVMSRLQNAPSLDLRACVVL